MAKFGKSIVGDDIAVEVTVSPQYVPASAPVVEAAVPPPPPPVTPAPAAVPAPPPPEFNFSVAEPSAEPKKEEGWVKSMWRPAMGWLYMLICLMDFVVFPAIPMFLPVMLKGIGITMQYAAWQSLTLSNGGLIHMAFGAILGVAAYGRTQEKVASKQ
jgi:hypothetical protein